MIFAGSHPSWFFHLACTTWFAANPCAFCAVGWRTARGRLGGVVVLVRIRGWAGCVDDTDGASAPLAAAGSDRTPSDRGVVLILPPSEAPTTSPVMSWSWTCTTWFAANPCASCAGGWTGCVSGCSRARSRLTSSLVRLESTWRIYNSNVCTRTEGRTVWLEDLHMHGIAAFDKSICKKPTSMKFQTSRSQLRLCDQLLTWNCSLNFASVVRRSLIS